jgi:hypothetical protein
MAFGFVNLGGYVKYVFAKLNSLVMVGVKTWT